MSRSSSIDHIASGWVLRRDKGLSSAEQSEFAKWQAADPRHAEAVARKDKAWANLDRPLQAGQASVILEKLETRATSRRKRRIGAASTALVLLIAFGITWQVRQNSVTVPAEIRGVVFRPNTRTLQDGSIIELRGDAEVAVRFTDAVRGVTLTKGEAHFNVAKNPDRPFVVTAGGIEFRAVGTAFSVNLASKEVEILVTEGRVAVEKPSIAATETLATVDEGKHMVIELTQTGPVEAPAIIAPADMAERMAWRAPKIEFSEIPLAEAVAMMNEHNQVKFIVDDAELARLPISGIFRADNTDTFVRILEGNFGIQAVRTENTILLRKARP